MEALLTKLSFVVSIGLKFLILFLLIRHRFHRRFLWFSIYIVYEILESVLRLSMSGNKILYFWAYWLTEIGDVSLMVLAFGESFLNVFRVYTRLRWFVAIVWSCIGAALLYAVFRALVFPPVQASRRGTVIIDSEVGINFALSVVAILYFGLGALFKITGYRWESGIISGFTIYVATAISAFLIISVFGKRFGTLSAWLTPMGFLLAEATWAFELSRPEPPPRVPIRELNIDDLTKLEEYRRALERILGRKS